MNKEIEAISEMLPCISPAEYGEKYRDHLLEQYKLYLTMTDKMSDRRMATNSFFLTVNTSLITAIGLTNILSPKLIEAGQIQINSQATGFLFIIVGIAALTLCYFWYRLIRSYKGLNSAKFEVIYQIENLLPLRPYNAEWEAIGRGEDKNLYLPFTHVEIYIPWIFMALYIALIVFGIFRDRI